MIEKKEDKYPVAHDVVKIHPKAGNIGNQCPYCTKKNPKNMINNSTTAEMVLHYDNEHGWRIYCRIYSSIMDVVASMYSDEDIYHCSFSDKIEFCPKCSRKLV